MSARVLTNDEYAKLAAKVGAEANQMKSVHRLLCDGHAVEALTPAEQACAAVFAGAQLAKIPNDYGWEPAIKVADAETVQTPTPEPKPKKNGK